MYFNYIIDHYLASLFAGVSLQLNIVFGALLFQFVLYLKIYKYPI